MDEIGYRLLRGSGLGLLWVLGSILAGLSWPLVLLGFVLVLLVSISELFFKPATAFVGITLLWGIAAVGFGAVNFSDVKEVAKEVDSGTVKIMAADLTEGAKEFTQKLAADLDPKNTPLKQKLQDIESAYNAGLITDTERDSMREEVLAEFSTDPAG